MIRHGLIRLICIAIFGLLAGAAALAALEAGYRIAGRSGQIGPLDYAARWRTVQDWNPGNATQAAIFAGAVAVGLALLWLASGRSRAEGTVEIARMDNGPVLLTRASVRAHLRDRLRERDWIRNSAPRIQWSGAAVSLTDRPRTGRPWRDAELAEATDELAGDIARFGLVASKIDVAPRAPSGRDAARVR